MARPELRGVVALASVDLSGDHIARELRGALAQAREHLLLLGAVLRGERGRHLVGELDRELLERVVGSDLERLGRALVLGVLQQLLLAGVAAEQVDRALGKREDLADEALDDAHSRLDEALADPELAEAPLEPPRLALRNVER